MIDVPVLGRALVSRRTLIWAGALAAVAAVLAFIPLFDVLGFEFSFVIGLIASFAAADLGGVVARRLPAAGILRRFLTAAAHNLIVLLVPLAIILANGLRVRSCDTVAGLQLYAILPALSVLAATTVGVVAAQLFPRHPRVATTASILFVVGSIVLGVARFYAAPPIYGYDPFAGYFPGSLYDETIKIGGALAWSRVYQGALCLGALAACGFARTRRRGLLVLALGAAAAGAFLNYEAPALGFAATSADIAAALGGVKETAHFIIYYPKNAAFAGEMDAIAADHEFRWAQDARNLGVAPAGKITSFYFASPDEKARWMGAANIYVAKPWRHEIYLSHAEFPHGSLRHEIAHVFAGEFGDPLFHVSVAWLAWPPAQFNVGLIEGAAVAADWPGGVGLTPDQSVRAMLDLGMLPPLDKILAPGFFAFSPAQSYTTAGSFCHFLIQHDGLEKFRALYRAGGRGVDFQHIYDKPLATLESEWRAEIATVEITDRDREAARERYRQRGIFSRPCPHAIAEEEGRARLLAANGDPTRAAAVMQEVCKEDPGEPLHRFALAGILEHGQQDDEAAAAYRGLAGDPRVSAALRATALLRLVDLLGRKGDLDGARQALAQALALPVDDASRRNLEVRARALAAGPDAAALRSYLFARSADGGDPDSLMLLERAHAVIAAAPGNGIGHYLAGRILWQRGDNVDATAELATATQLGLDEPLVARENDRILVVAAFRAGDLTAARAAAVRLAAPNQPPGTRLEGEDWLERCRFVESGRL